MNVALLKKKSSTKKIHNIFHKLSWQTFTSFYLSPPLIPFFFTYHYQSVTSADVKIFVKIFVYILSKKKKKNYMVHVN